MSLFKRQNWHVLIGDNIRRIRTELGLTLNELSLLSGIEAANLSRVERGLRDVKISTLAKVAAALRVELPDLLVPDDPDLAVPADTNPFASGDGHLPPGPTRDAKGYDLDVD